MTHQDCLTEQELILHYYEELPANGLPARHLATCQRCTQRLADLREDLARLPTPGGEPDALAGARMAARVREKLATPRRRSWLPVFSAGTVAALALVIGLTRSPQPEFQPAPHLPSLSTTVMEMTALDLTEDLPDIEFLENLELLQELELLSQIEGV